VLDQVILAPLANSLQAQEMDPLLQHVLDEIEQHRARLAIFDLTGVPDVDGTEAESLIRLIKSTNLLGVECILVGIRPCVAGAILDAGLDLSALTGKRDVQSAIEYALERTGRQIVALDQQG
jgi:rsbT co-antagonist protein RsbR